MKSTLSFLLKAIVSLGLISWLIYQENPARIVASIRTVDFGVLVAAFGLYLLAITAGAYKWGLLLTAQDVRVPLYHLVRYTFVGLFFGNFLPSNVGGDVVRAYDLARYTERAAVSSASVVVDRLTGLTVFIGSAAVMGVVAVLWLDQPALLTVTIVSVVVFLGCLAVFAILTQNNLMRQLGKVFKLAPPLYPFEQKVWRIADSFAVYRTKRSAVFAAALVSFGIQCLTSVVNWMVGMSLHLDIPFVFFFVFNPLIAFILLLPISINGIGLKQAIYVFFYSNVAQRVDESQALTMSLMMHTIIIGSGLLGSFFWLQRRAARSSSLEVELHESPVSQS